MTFGWNMAMVTRKFYELNKLVDKLPDAVVLYLGT